MKIVLCIFSICFCACLYRCCTDKPFIQELPFLLMPDTSSKIFLYKTSLSDESFLWDTRSDCIQTNYNFSIYSYWKVPFDPSAKQEISSTLSSNINQLFVHEPLFKNAVLLERKPVVWIEKKIHPVRLISENLSTDNFVDDFVKTGKNFLPCKIDVKNP